MQNKVAIMKITKSSNRDSAVVGDIVTFKLVISNDGDVIIGNITNEPVYIYDILPPELGFIRGSVKIDNTPQPTLDINTGIDLGILKVNESKSITFDAEVLSYNDSLVTNVANGSFGYTILGGNPRKGMSTSNTIELQLSKANIDVIKVSDKEFVVLGDNVTYTVKLTNSGTLDATNVIFKDILPKGATIVDGSFTVNGISINSVNLEKGVNIGNIQFGTSSIIQYMIKVLEPTCSLQLKNQASVQFAYKLPDGTTGKRESKITSVSSNLINLGITNFKQLSIEEYLNIPCVKPDVEAINNVNGTVEIIKCHVIQTGQIRSTEGQNLSGYKLVVHGVIKETIEYTACEETQSVHSASYDIPFSTFIVLPANYMMGSKIEIDGFVEDIYYKALDCRTLFTNTTILINAKILSC